MAIFQDTYSRARRNARKVILGGVVVATAGVVVASPWSSSGAQTANIWVSNSGSYSGCARSSTPVAYDASKDCAWGGSTNSAYSVASSGDAVIVKGGSYGNVTHQATRSGSPAVTYSIATGETVTVQDFLNGWINDGTTSGANNITFNGPVTARQFRADDTSGVTVDNWDVNGQGIVAQIFHVENATNFTARNGSVHNARAQNTTGAMTYINGSGFTFDTMNFYDALYSNPSGGAHTECMYATSVSTLTIKRSKFYSCATEDLFITGGSTAANYTIENSIFQKPNGTSGNHNALAFRNGGAPSPYPTGLVLRYNVIDGVQPPDSTSSATGAITGNYFRTNAPCGWGSITYSRNTGSSPCANGTTVSTSAADAGFNGATWTSGDDYTATDAGDYTLKSGSPLIDAGTTSNYPSVDLLGNSRYNGTAPDAGAYEYGG